MISPGEESAQLVISKWIDENTFTPPSDLPEKLQVILIGEMIPSDDLAFHCAFGIFELQGAFEGTNKTLLKNASLFIVTPGYPRFKVAGGLSSDLREEKIEHVVSASNFADGIIEIYLESDKRTVSIAWKLDVQFAGKLDDKTCFFDVDRPRDFHACGSDSDTLEKLTAYYSSSGSVDTLWYLNPYDVLPNKSQLSSLSAKSPVEAQVIALTGYQQCLDLLEAYVEDHYDEATGNFLIGTYYEESGATDEGGTAPASDLLCSKEYTVSVSFLTVLELVGSIGKGGDRLVSARLYVRVPILGRVNISALQGALRKEGSRVFVTATINVKVAKGNVYLALEDKDLYIGLDLNIKLVGNIRQAKFKLLTLPF